MQQKEIEEQKRQDYDRMILLWAKCVDNVVYTLPGADNTKPSVTEDESSTAKSSYVTENIPYVVPEESSVTTDKPFVITEEQSVKEEALADVDEPPADEEEASGNEEDLLETVDESLQSGEESSVNAEVSVEGVINTIDEDDKSHLDELNKLGVSVIKKNDDGSYSGYYNNAVYNCLWDPIEHKWLTYNPDNLTSAGARDKALARVAKILAALAMGLKFTADINTCKDSQGNVYKYDEESGTYVMQK